ncbi:MAG: hypothetical protein ACFHW5_03410 [Verrucomicrobiota bacterium]
MKNRSYQDWIDLHWQRTLTPEETGQWEAFLQENPDHREEWKWDQQLMEGVHHLADVPLSNNFTSRVIRSVEHLQPDSVTQESEARRSESGGWAKWWSLPGIRIAGTSVVLLAGFWLWQWDPTAPSMVESITTVTQAETAPTVEELENFDAISGLAQTSTDVDWELVFAMD